MSIRGKMPSITATYEKNYSLVLFSVSSNAGEKLTGVFLDSLLDSFPPNSNVTLTWNRLDKFEHYHATSFIRLKSMFGNSKVLAPGSLCGNFSNYISLIKSMSTGEINMDLCCTVDSSSEHTVLTDIVTKPNIWIPGLLRL